MDHIEVSGGPRGADRISALAERFPQVPRSILLKCDVLREGIRYTPDLETAGELTFPHSLIWNPRHSWNPRRAGSGSLITIPWKIDLEDGTPILVRPGEQSPYELRRLDGGFGLWRDGELVAPVSLEERAEWILRNTSTGTLMASVFLSWTRRALLGCALRYCEYSRDEEQCVYCCLDADLRAYREAGISYDLSVKPENAAETYRAALEEVGEIVDVSFTGGSLRDPHREVERYIPLFAALDEVRREMGARSEFSACMTAPPDRDLMLRLRDAGVNRLAPNMDCWEERLWPVIVPGKHRYVGRQTWLDAMVQGREIFGRGWVMTNFVVGPEMVAPGGFASLEEGVASWRRCFKWLLDHEVVPLTSQWQVEVGSPWGEAIPPPTEYFVAVGQAHHELMEASGAYDYQHCYYARAMAWSTTGDFRRLVRGCNCRCCA